MRLTTLSNIFIALLGMVTVVIVVIGLWSLHETRLVRSAWQDYERGPATKSAILAELRDALGYGGFIHDFKNFVLRKDRGLIERLQGNLKRLSAGITAYRAVGLSEREEAAVVVLEGVVLHFAESVAVAERLAREQVSPTEIDQRVRLSGAPAVGALMTLQDELSNAREASAVQIFEAITQGTQLVTVAGLLAGLLLTLMVVALAWFTRRRIVRPLSVLGGAMQALAGGDRSVKIPDLDQRTELGEMAQIMAVFKQNAIERQRAESRLQDAIEAISEGFVMYDKRDRLVLCNTTYKQLYETSSDLFEPGARFEDIIREGARRGQYPAALGRVEEWVAERMELHRSCQAGMEQSLPGGRWLLASEYRAKDGGIVGIRSDITLRKQAERQARERERQLRLITNKMPAVVAHVDLDHRFRFINSTGASWYGRPEDEIIGRTVGEVLGKSYQERTERYIKSAYSGQNVVFEMTVAHPDGVTRDVEASYIPDLAEDGRVVGVFVMALDITQRLASERELRFNEARFRGVVDNSPSAIFLKDLQGRFLLANKKFEEWYGVSGESVPGMTSHDIYPKEKADLYIAQDMAVAQSGEPIEEEREITFADGTVHPIIISKFPVLDLDGSLLGIGTFNTDLSQQREAERQLRQAQKMDAVGQLTGGIAHDFNNLLMIIGGNANIAMRSLDNAVAAEDALDNVLRATEQATSLTRQLLTFSRRQITEKRVFNVAQTLREVGELLPSSLGERFEVGLEIEDEGACVETDAGEFNQALLNLAINARDAMPDGGKVALGQRIVELDEAALAEHPELTPGRYVEIYVTDHGEGISPELLTRILEPFFTTKEHGKGTGLGLSMVYGFAKQSGGDIEISSTVGSGTTVRVLLPATEALPLDTLSEVQDLHYGSGETVLLVEDNEPLRQLVASILKELGYEVLTAADGLDALEVEEGHEAPIDLLLSDVVMPAMGGIELAEMIRATRPDIRIVFMSGYPDRDRSQSELPEGCSFLQKPVKPEVLARAIWEQLGGVSPRNLTGSRICGPSQGQSGSDSK